MSVHILLHQDKSSSLASLLTRRLDTSTKVLTPNVLNNIVKYQLSPEEINTINFISRYRKFFFLAETTSWCGLALCLVLADMNN